MEISRSTGPKADLCRDSPTRDSPRRESFSAENPLAYLADAESGTSTITSGIDNPSNPTSTEQQNPVSTKQKRPPSQKQKLATYSTYGLFFTLFATFVPFVISHSLTFWSFVLSFLLFNALVPLVTYTVSRFEFSSSLIPRKKVEVINRIISIIFNLSVTFHTWDLYLELGVFGLPKRAAILTGDVWILDFFSGWSIGYILYDFIYLVSVYGETSYAILLHHCGEMLIVTAYIYNPPLGGIYTVSGAVMLLSSAVLHVQRISYLLKAPQRALFIIKCILLITWITGRLVAAPHLMVVAVMNLPFNALHFWLAFTGLALFSMNLLWGIKIAKKNDLGF